MVVDVAELSRQRRTQRGEHIDRFREYRGRTSAHVADKDIRCTRGVGRVETMQRVKNSTELSLQPFAFRYLAYNMCTKVHERGML